MRDFDFKAGSMPLVVPMPHAGTAIPDDIAARWSRYVIDLNRPPEDGNLYPGLDTTGLCPLDTFGRELLYRNGQAPSPADVAARLARYWQPYHRQLHAELDRLPALHGCVVLWDAHSIASMVPRFFDGRLADLNFGTAGGASCDASLATAAIAPAHAARRFGIAQDGRFKGGYITRHYGQPTAGVHAIQLEMCQCLYMNERAPFDYRPDLAAQIQPVLRRMIGGALFARHALLAQGWASDVLLEWDGACTLLAVTAGTAAPPGVEQAQLVLPGMVNLHSHAFQRALGGLTETAGDRLDSPDSFLTWRDLMYRFARTITPGQIEAIAAQLFVERLRHGYTAVCEFHYLQRTPGGDVYPRPAETAEPIVAASRAAGIGLTMLPVLYGHAGFGQQVLSRDQQRFGSDLAQLLGIVDALEVLRGGQLEVGAAPHSLRAATVAQIAALAQALPAGRPLHIHIAERQDEVRQCVDATGMRPLRYLAEHVALDERWCLVHATHIDADETVRLARSGAVAGLCPSTEVNLGDGLFPLAPYIAAGGRFGIGSDSHVSHSPVEERRWLEYGQRLRHQRRNVAAAPNLRRVGDFLRQGALRGGAQASGRRVDALGGGMRADLLVLDSAHPNLDGAAADDVLGAVVFAGNDNLVRDVLAGGRWAVRGARHVEQDAIARRYKHILVALRETRS